MIARIKISNHPVLTDVERYVNVRGFENVDFSSKELNFKYYIECRRDLEDVTRDVRQELPTWILRGDEFDEFIAAVAVESDKAAGLEMVVAGEVSKCVARGMW